MTIRYKGWLSVVAMAVLVFIGINLPFLSRGGITTGPHRYLQVGVTGWLQLHQQVDRWSVEEVDFRLLAAEVCIAILLTWILSKACTLFRDERPAA